MLNMHFSRKLDPMLPAGELRRMLTGRGKMKMTDAEVRSTSSSKHLLSHLIPQLSPWILNEGRGQKQFRLFLENPCWQIETFLKKHFLRWTT